jgi:hypothetical protein
MFTSFKETYLNLFIFYIYKYISPVQYRNARMTKDVTYVSFLCYREDNYDELLKHETCVSVIKYVCVCDSELG